LSRAFLLSGARAVAGSLWAVDDRETARLMPWFYTALRAGQSPDQALRTAQRRMIQSGGPSAFPGSWAGFVITGESRRQVF
jgi:CHAT domain-containing protein